MTQSVSLNATQQQAYDLVQKARSGDNSAVNELCTGIFNATAGQLGANKDYLNEVLSSADSETLALIMDSYSYVTGSEIYKDIENELLYSDKDEVISKLDSAYKETKGAEYTGDNDGKLTIGQTAKSIGKGLLNKSLSIGLLAAGTYFAPAIAGAIGTGLSALVGATAATTIAAVGAPILAAIGVATSGYMIYKGITETKEAIEIAQNSGSDEVTEQAVTQGTEGVIDTAEGIYLGVQSAKGLYDSVKNLKSATAKTPETTQEVTSETPTEVGTKTVEPVQAKETTNITTNNSNSPNYKAKKEILRQRLDGDVYEGDMPARYSSLKNQETGELLTYNDVLRTTNNIQTLPDDIRMEIELADENWQNVRALREDTWLYRGETPYKGNDGWKHYNYIKNTTIGEVITDKGYMYASPNEVCDAYKAGGTFTQKGAECIQYEIKCPKGSRIVNGGHEYIFNRNSSFKIISKTINNDGVIEVGLEYIPNAE